uniref:Lipase domain-containing protein n=1 Tax=Tetranychus urticae TaxID=32264 RepID=T1KJB3_TETUR
MVIHNFKVILNPSKISGRIAGPLYNEEHTTYRLNSEDADYVDSISTDNGKNIFDGLGLVDSAATTAGMKGLFKNGFIKGFSCSYGFANRIPILNTEESSNSCQYVGNACHDYETIARGECNICNDYGRDCALNSIFAIGAKTLTEPLVSLDPTIQLRALLYHFGIMMDIDNTTRTPSGSFKLTLHGSA